MAGRSSRRGSTARSGSTCFHSAILKGIDYGPILGLLSEIGYDGYVTVHHNVADGLDIEEGVRSFAEYLLENGDFLTSAAG